MKNTNCTGCPLECHGRDFTAVEGLGTFGIMIVAEASGEHEAREGLPLRSHAPSGMIFERTLRRLGYSRDQFSVTNVIRCRPRDNLLDGMPYESAALAHCQPNLLAALQKFKPKVLIALGNVAFRTLTGISGTKLGVSHVRGYVFKALPQFAEAAGVENLLVIPTYHPAFLRRGAIHLTGVFARDIQRAVNIRAGKDTSFILEPPPSIEGRERDSLDDANVDAWLKRHNLRYNLHPTLADLDLFCRDVKARSEAWQALTPDAKDHSLIALSHDIETYESASLDEDESDGYTDTQVRLSQFSVEPGQAIAMPWRDNFIQATRWLLKLPLPKVGQNYWYFDQRVLRAVGRRDYGDENHFKPDGTVYDTLQQFHYCQPDLPAHLQYAASYVQFLLPWKHLNDDNLELYGCFDPDAAIRIFYMTRKTMQDRGIWSDPMPGRDAVGYLNMVQAVRPILADMEDRGLPINDVRRLELGAQFNKVEAELLVELDARFPDEARKLTPKEKGIVKGYAGVPPQVKDLAEQLAPLPVPVFTEVVVGVDKAGKDKTEFRDMDGLKVTKKLATDTLRILFDEHWANLHNLPMLMDRIRATKFSEPPEINDDGEEVPGENYSYDYRTVGQQLMNGVLAAGTGSAWVRVYQFSPNSSQQLMSYMRAKRHDIPFDKKRKRETTSKKDLERLAVKHHDDLYTKTIECREMGKMSSTYVDGFKPAADGRVHTTFTFATATGQLSSRKPSTQTYPAHGKLGKLVKSMIEAPAGMEIANWDFKSFHVVLTGFLAEDPAYMRMARLDMHSFVTWHFAKLPDADKLIDMPDGELMAKFSWLKKQEKLKKIRDRQSKPSILGIALGLMPNHLYEMNREHFDSLAQAKQFRELIQRLFPKVFRWQNAVCEEAHQRQVLGNRFGMLRWFYEVMIPDGRGGWRAGDQYNAAMALRVQSEAHGELREKLKAMHKAGVDEKYGLNNTIHDSYQLCYPIGLRDQMLHDVSEIISRPSRVLIHPTMAPDGLVIGIECAVGPNMASLEEVVVPEHDHKVILTGA